MALNHFSAGHFGSDHHFVLEHEAGAPAVDVPVGICTNVASLPGATKYEPVRRKLFRSQWWKKKRRIVVGGIEAEPLKPFKTFDAVLPPPTVPPAMLMRTRRASKARLHRTAAPAIPPASLIRSKPTFLPLIRS